MLQEIPTFSLTHSSLPVDGASRIRGALLIIEICLIRSNMMNCKNLASSSICNRYFSSTNLEECVFKCDVDFV